MGQEQVEGSGEQREERAAPGRKAMGLIFLTVLIDLIGFGLIIPALPTYAQELKADEQTVGYLIASYSLMQLIFMPIWGRLSDRVGRKPILLVSLFFSAAGYLVWGLADSLVMLFVARLVAGFGNANIAVAQAYMTDVTSSENRAKGMGLIGAAFGLGFVLGPALGAGLAAMGLGLNVVGFVAFGFSLFDLVLTALILPEPEKRSDAGQSRFGMGPSFYFKTLASKDLRVSFAIFLVSTFAFANMEATIVLLTNEAFHFSHMDNMFMFLYIGLLMVVVQGRLIHGLNKRFGEKKLIVAGCALIACGLLLTPVTRSVPVLYGALFLLALGTGINTPANQSLISKLAPLDSVGGVMGVGQSLATLGRILGPCFGGFAFQYWGFSSPYNVGAATMVLAVLLGFCLPRVPVTDAKTRVGAAG
ncbi:MAG: MFS transporter [Candidatus Obscuribacterales bacterium]